MPLCSRCHQSLPESEFYADRTRSGGLSSRCKECDREAQRARYAADPDRGRQHSRKWREEHLEQKRAADREYHRRKKQEG